MTSIPYELTIDREWTSLWGNRITDELAKKTIVGHVSASLIAAAIPLIALAETFELLGKASLCCPVALLGEQQSAKESLLTMQGWRIAKVAVLILFAIVATVTLPITLVFPKVLIAECDALLLRRHQPEEQLAPSGLPDKPIVSWRHKLGEVILETCEHHPLAFATTLALAAGAMLALIVRFTLSGQTPEEARMNRICISITTIAAILSYRHKKRVSNSDDANEEHNTLLSSLSERCHRIIIATKEALQRNPVLIQYAMIAIPTAQLAFELFRHSTGYWVNLNLPTIEEGELQRAAMGRSSTVPQRQSDHIRVGSFTLDQDNRIWSGTGAEYFGDVLFRVGTWSQGALTGAMCWENGIPRQIGWFDGQGHLIKGRQCHFDGRCQEGIYDAEHKLIESKKFNPWPFPENICQPAQP